MQQQYKELKDQNKLIVYRPKCPRCKRDMFTDKLGGWATRNNTVGADHNVVAPEYFSVSPPVTWFARIFKCQKHPEISSKLSNEMLDLINSYPHNNVRFESL